MSYADHVKSNIKLVCCARKKGYPGWPHVDFDHEGMMNRYLPQLQAALPNCQFTVVYYSNAEEAQAGFADNDQYDGVVIFNATHGIGVANEFVRLGKPGVIVDELYAGSGDLVRLNTRINKEHLPIVVVASSDFQDTIQAIRLLHVRKQLASSKIVLFKNFEPISESTEAFLKEALGTGSTWKRYLAGPEGLKDKLNKLKENFGIEPSKEDVFNSARMYLGLKHCVEEEQADAVSVDCIMMFYTTDLSVYPCMSHSQMCDDGLTGTCESDIDSTLTQLAIRYLTGRAGFISDPVIDTATNQIIYAHCSAATKWFGPDSAPSPYFLRSHSEDHNSTSIQTIMPVGETVTTVKMDIETHSMALHTAKAVGNVTEEKGCRTKLAGEVPDAQVLLDNWDTDVFSWHKVTFYGDYRKDFLNLAKLYSMKTIQEDRLNPGC